MQLHINSRYQKEIGSIGSELNEKIKTSRGDNEETIYTNEEEKEIGGDFYRNHGASRSRRMVLTVGNFLDRHVLDSVGVRLELIDVQH